MQTSIFLQGFKNVLSMFLLYFDTFRSSLLDDVNYKKCSLVSLTIPYCFWRITRSVVNVKIEKWSQTHDKHINHVKVLKISQPEISSCVRPARRILIYPRYYLNPPSGSHTTADFGLGNLVLISIGNWPYPMWKQGSFIRKHSTNVSYISIHVGSHS